MGGRGHGPGSGIVLLNIGPFGIAELIIILVVLVVIPLLVFLFVRLIRLAWRS